MQRERRAVRAGLAAPQPAHPGRLLVDHPARRFACASCHGSGRDELAEADGRALHGRRVQSSCLHCHRQTDALPGAELLGVGVRAYRRLGCGGCHTTPNLEAGRRIGPPLDGVTEKLPQSYLRAFLSDPQQVRPGTAMPSFFSEDVLRGAPELTADPTRQRRAAEIEELLAFLAGSRSDATADSAATTFGDAAMGARRLEQLGCVACHRTATRQTTPGLGGIGPDLSTSRERLSRRWLLDWLTAPSKLWPATRMPGFRLDGPERVDLAAALGGPEHWPDPGLPKGPALCGRGRALAERLGCGGCHQSRALEGAALAGPELDGFGDKRLELLDWGHALEPHAQRSVWRWTELKLEEPRRFDRRPGVLTMPWQKLRPGEREGLVLLLRSLSVEEHGPLARGVARLPEQREGERLIEELACRQCHRQAGRGGALGTLFSMPAEAPPDLDGEGAKVQPAWLYRFLDRPTPLRPWLTPRMPTPAASATERQALTAGLAARDDGSYPFIADPAVHPSGSQLEESLLLFERLQCLRCHLLSNAPKLKPGELSPDLALGASRLRRGWIRRFILDPQKLMPGTRMPNLFPLVDEDDPKSRTTAQTDLLGGSVERQVEALTDLSLWWGTAEAARRASGGLRSKHR